MNSPRWMLAQAIILAILGIGFIVGGFLAYGLWWERVIMVGAGLLMLVAANVSMEIREVALYVNERDTRNDE